MTVRKNMPVSAKKCYLAGYVKSDRHKSSAIDSAAGRCTASDRFLYDRGMCSILYEDCTGESIGDLDYPGNLQCRYSCGFPDVKTNRGKTGHQKASILGTGGLAVFLVLLYFLPSSQALVFVILFVAQTIFGVAYGLTTSMYSMCGTDSEYRTGKDTKGIIMACSSLAIKIAIALRGIVISAALAAIAYDPDAAVTASAQGGIKMVFLIIPAVFSIASVVMFLLYRIKDSDIEKMEQEIAKRRA